MTGTRYVDNPVYGPFPVCSRNGLIDFNQVVGGDSAGGPSVDTGIYVGDDDQITVRHNSVTNYVIGVVVENTIHATVRDNLLQQNTAGIGTHTGEFLGMAATRKSVQVPYCLVYDLRDGKIAGLRACIPMELFAQQLG